MSAATMKFIEFRLGNRILSFGETGLSLVRYEYKSLLANQSTPMRGRVKRNKSTLRRLFKGHRP